jgi:hypothetical protein
VSGQFQKFIVFAAVGAVAAETLHGHQQQHFDQQTPIQPDYLRAVSVVVSTATLPPDGRFSAWTMWGTRS